MRVKKYVAIGTFFYLISFLVDKIKIISEDETKHNARIKVLNFEIINFRFSNFLYIELQQATKRKSRIFMLKPLYVTRS